MIEIGSEKAGIQSFGALGTSEADREAISGSAKGELKLANLKCFWTWRAIGKDRERTWLSVDQGTWRFPTVLGVWVLLLSCSHKLFQGYSLEMERWCWGSLDWVCDWTQVRPIFKFLRFWQGSEEIYSSCNCLRQALYVNYLCLLNLSIRGSPPSFVFPCLLFGLYFLKLSGRWWTNRYPSGSQWWDHCLLSLWFRARKTCFWFQVMICVEMLECQFCVGAFICSRVFFDSVYNDQKYSKKRLGYCSESPSEDKAEQMSQKTYNRLTVWRRSKLFFFIKPLRILSCHCNIIYFMVMLDVPVHPVLLFEAEAETLQRINSPWRASVSNQNDCIRWLDMTA